MSKTMLAHKVRYCTQVPSGYDGLVAIITMKTLPMATALPMHDAVAELARLYTCNPQGQFFIVPAVA